MSVQTSYGVTRTIAIEGQLADNGPHDVIPLFNGESSAKINFGRAVKWNGTDGLSAKLPAAESDIVAGIVVHANQYSTGSDGELTSTGLIPGAMMSVLRKGRVWVMARTAVVAGVSRLWVRAVSSETGYEVYGGLEDADDGTDTIDCTACGVFLDTGAQGALVRLEVDFTNEQ